MQISSQIDLVTISLLCLGLNVIIGVVLFLIYKSQKDEIPGLLHLLVGFYSMALGGIVLLLKSMLVPEILTALTVFLLLGGASLFTKGFKIILKVPFKEWQNIPLTFGPVAAVMLISLSISYTDQIFIFSLFLLILLVFAFITIRQAKTAYITNSLLAFILILILLNFTRLSFLFYYKNISSTEALLVYDRVFIFSIVIVGYGIIACMFYTIGSEISRRANFLSEKNKILAKEMNHRVNNNLNRIIGMVNIMQDEVGMENISNAFKIIQSRIFSISQIHQQLYKTNSLRDIRVDIYLPQLVSQVIDSFGYNQVQLQVTSDEVTIDSDRGLLLGMLVNELAINSCKYAFNKSEAGNLWLKMQIRNEEIVIEYKDSGSGILPTDEKGFGSEIIKQIIKTLDASIQYIRNGNFEVEIKFKKETSNITDSTIAKLSAAI